MTLSEKIAYCRKKAGLSQEELAAQVGVSRQAVSKWELGDASPDIGKLLALAKAFGVTTDWLLSEEGPAQEEGPTPDPANAPPTAEHTWVDSVPGAVDVIYHTLADCGLDWDEGPDKGGPVGPYVQTERRGLYLPYAQRLVERGHAYYCFCDKADSEEESAHMAVLFPGF